MDDEATIIPTEVLDYCNVRVPFDSVTGDWRDYCIEVRHPLLQWTYASACVPGDHANSNCPRLGEVFSHILERLDRLLPSKLFNFSPDQRSTQAELEWHKTFEGDGFVWLSSSWDGFNRRITHRYLYDRGDMPSVRMDHMIPEWYAMYERAGEFYQAHLRRRYELYMQTWDEYTN